MITRILALVALLFVASGGTWYLLRDTPQKRIARWRDEAKYFLEKTANLEMAEELTRKVLELVPSSAYDNVFLAAIKERRGTVASLKEALEIYDKVLANGEANVLGVAILKARVCRSLGLIPQAQGTLLSVVDLFPFESMLELGEASLAGLAAGDAYQYFMKAKEVASSAQEQARAQEGLANALMLLLSMSSGQEVGSATVSPRDPVERAKLAEALKKGVRKALNEALQFLKSDDNPNSPADADRRLVWATLLTEKLAQVKEEGSTPFTDGIVLIDGRRGDYGVRGKESSPLLVRMGALRLWALRDEPPRDEAAATTLAREAEKNFTQALGKTPEEARTLLAEAMKEPEKPRETKPKLDEPKDRARPPDANSVLESYLQFLLSISRVCLGTSQSQRLLKDDSELALSKRIDDVIESGHPAVSGLLTLLRGFAHFKAGHALEGEKAIDDFLASLPSDARARGVVDVAEQSLALFPSEPIGLRQLDKFQAQGGDVLDHVGRRVALLVSARSKDKLADQASTTLESLLKQITEAAKSVQELVGVSKILYSIKGKVAAASVLQVAVKRYPNDASVERLYADLEYEISIDPATTQPEKEAAYKEALAAYLYLFVKAPGDSQEIVRRSVEIVRRTEESRADVGFERSLRRFFPSAPERAFETFSSSLRLFLLAQFGPSLDRVSSIGPSELEQFRPFSNFLKGSCHVGLATYLLRESQRATSESTKLGLQSQHKSHVQSAMEEFRREPDSTACKFELFNLELQNVPPGEDLPDDLLRRIRALSEMDGHEHSANFLLARAYQIRFSVRYRQKNVKNSELLKLLSNQQVALRAAIRKSPSFNPAYLALAETFVGADRNEGASTGFMNRDLFTPSPQKAVSILRAVPGPDDVVLTRLAQLYDAMGRVDLSLQQLELVAQRRPSVDVFSRLLAGYLKSKSPAVRVFLDDEVPADLVASPGDALKERIPLLLSLRKTFEGLPEREGLTHMFRGMEAERNMAQAVSTAPKLKARSIMVDEYLKALDAYDAKNLNAPLLLVNNLAWHLSEEPDADRKARSLQLGERLKKLVPDPKVAPDAHDTCAWVLHKSERHGEAETVLRNLLKSVDQPLYRFHLARVLFAQKKYDEALKEVQVTRDSSRPFAEAGAARDLEYEIREARRKAIGE